MAKPTNVVEALEAAKGLLEPEGAWIQGAFHRKVNGQACYCTIGAVRKVMGLDEPARLSAGIAAIYNASVHALDRAAKKLGPDLLILEFNDLPSTQKSDILALLDSAISLAKGGAL